MSRHSLTSNFARTALVAVAAGFISLGSGPAGAQELEAVTLRLQDYSPPSGARVEAVRSWIAAVEERSNGQITFQTFFGGGLVPANEAMEAVSTGLADVGMINASLHPADLPLHSMSSLPFGAHSFEAAGQAWMALYDEIPELRAELEAQNLIPLTIQGTPPMQLRFRNAIEGPDDMAGRQVRSFGAISAAIENWGATPVSMPFTEIYEALRLGTIDGAVDYIYTAEAYRLYEAGEYFVNGDFGAFPTQPFVFNKDRWESLQPEAREILLETAQEAFGTLVANFNEADETGLDLMREHGNTILELSEEERQSWIEAADADGIWAAWAEEMEAQGLPGTKMSERYLELMH